jgi:Kef-type K+ transport system membrane component KefB
MGHSEVGWLLFGVAVLVLAARAGGLLVERWGQPAVLGELLVGILLGNALPAALGGAAVEALRSAPAIVLLAEMGVLILLFDVGLEADLGALARVGGSAVLVALIGVALPVGLGWAASAWLLPDRPWLVHAFVGATLAATSVGITARVLKDLRATQSREGRIVIGAALVDDVLGLVLLAVVTGAAAATAGGSLAVTTLGILLRATLFLAAAAVAGHFFSRAIVRLVARSGPPGTMLVVGLALCFTLAYVAEGIGMAGIIGAFAAGLLLDPYGAGVRTRAEDATLNELLHPLSSLFVPLFFVVMGIQVDLATLLRPDALGLAAALTACALVGKLACGLGVVTRGARRLVVGIAMVPRGEVGLIFAGIGTTLAVGGRPALDGGLYAAIVFMVLVTTLVAPLGLRWVLAPAPD